VSWLTTASVFRDREQAGELLAGRLEEMSLPGPIVMGLPRGGVLVAAPVAVRLGAPLDALVVRKLGVPAQREYAFGAVGEGGVRVLDRRIVEWEEISDADIATVEDREWMELERRVRLYRGARLVRDLHGACVVLVDDGLATGASARAAVEVARLRGADRVIVAVPVASTEAVALLKAVGVAVVSLHTSASFGAVGTWYDNFEQVGDAEVIELLARYGR
jgi:putative phosphoribosyl transferase